LAMIPDILSSTRPVSILSLKGDDHDDPDVFPVTLHEDLPDSKVDVLSHGSTRVPPPSINALPNVLRILSPTGVSTSDHHFEPRDGSRDLPGPGTSNTQLDQPTKVQKLEVATGSARYIEVIDIDPAYRPQTEDLPKPITCFYIRFLSEQLSDAYYRAVYLAERTVLELKHKILEKHNINPDSIVRILYIDRNGLQMPVDDDVVRGLEEDQVMVAELSSIPIKGERISSDVDMPSCTLEVRLVLK